MKRKVSEKTVDRHFVKAVNDKGGLTFKCHPLTNKGIPDRVVHFQGRTFYVELKGSGETCSPIQIAFHAMLKKAGVETYVLDQKIKDFYELYRVSYKTYDDTYNKHLNGTT